VPGTNSHRGTEKTRSARRVPADRSLLSRQIWTFNFSWPKLYGRGFD
jgi:hypothetical protein